MVPPSPDTIASYADVFVGMDGSVDLAPSSAPLAVSVGAGAGVGVGTGVECAASVEDWAADGPFCTAGDPGIGVIGSTLGRWAWAPTIAAIGAGAGTLDPL